MKSTISLLLRYRNPGRQSTRTKADRYGSNRFARYIENGLRPKDSARSIPQVDGKRYDHR